MKEVGLAQIAGRLLLEVGAADAQAAIRSREKRVRVCLKQAYSKPSNYAISTVNRGSVGTISCPPSSHSFPAGQLNYLTVTLNQQPGRAG